MLSILCCFLLADLPPEAEVKPVKVAEVSHYCEGVVLDREGNLYFSNCDAGQIMKLTPDGSLIVWGKTPQPNGHKILPDGTHLVCDAPSHAVLKLDAQGKIVGTASKECEGKPLRGPNDLTLDLANGGFYFTDPGGSGKAKPIGTVHYVDKEGKTHLVASGLAFPNGIVLRSDGKTLLVAESQENRILEYPVLAPGQVGPRKVFANLPAKGKGQIGNEPDGMCLDTAGNLYIAHFGMKQVQVLSPEGKLLRRYEGGNLLTSNVAFAGPNMDQLYVTGGTGEQGGNKGMLYRLDLKGVKGLPILPQQRK
jgi:gluconolactonase